MLPVGLEPIAGEGKWFELGDFNHSAPEAVYHSEHVCVYYFTHTLEATA